MSEINSKLHNLVRDIREAEIKAVYYELFLKNEIDTINELENKIRDLYQEKHRLISEGAIDENPMTIKEKIDMTRDVVYKDKLLHNVITTNKLKHM